MINTTAKRSSSGFTLIELLVVIAIIGLLASVVLASLNTARQKARDARRASDMKQVQLALELYYDDNGQYPADPTSFYLENMVGMSPTYIPSLPTDPGSDRYFYGRSDGTGRNGQGYTLRVNYEGDGTGYCTIRSGPQEHWMSEPNC